MNTLKISLLFFALCLSPPVYSLTCEALWKTEEFRNLNWSLLKKDYQQKGSFSVTKLLQEKLLNLRIEIRGLVIEKIDPTSSSFKQLQNLLLMEEVWRPLFGGPEELVKGLVGSKNFLDSYHYPHDAFVTDTGGAVRSIDANFVIRSQSSGKIIGEIGADLQFLIPETGGPTHFSIANSHIALHPSYYGRGLGKSVMNSFFKALSIFYPIDSNQVKIFVGNASSLSLFEGLGFKYRESNKFQDIEYILLQRDH